MEQNNGMFGGEPQRAWRALLVNKWYALGTVAAFLVALAIQLLVNERLGYILIRLMMFAMIALFPMMLSRTRKAGVPDFKATPGSLLFGLILIVVIFFVIATVWSLFNSE
jgi:hypothetical protein